jgi:predicted nucleic acid-binding protein
MNKIFFDANIFIDLANASNDMHKAVVVLLNKIDRKSKQLYCSPTTFAITYFFFQKLLRIKLISIKE